MKALMKSFVFAAQGLWFCIRYERNFRIHLVAAAYTLWFAPHFAFSKSEWCVLFLTIAAVIASEAINTAMEHAVDLTTLDEHPCARVAKDAAAGAVLVCAMMSIGVAVVLFGELSVWLMIWQRLWAEPMQLVLLVASWVISVAFIFSGEKKPYTHSS